MITGPAWAVSDGCPTSRWTVGRRRWRSRSREATASSTSARGAIFVGFRIRGAFLYPNGQEIFHDPKMEAESILPEIPAGFNLTPFTILAIQLGAVAMALGPALYLRAKVRRPK